MEKVTILTMTCLLLVQLGICSLPRLPVSLLRKSGFILRPEDDDRIVGGIPAKPNELPYQVSLQVKSLSGVFHHFCGGALLTPTCVVTAGHCAQNRVAEKLFVVAGTTTLKDSVSPLLVENIIINPTYDQSDVYNDIAVIKLVTPLVWSEALQPIRLPPVANTSTTAGTPTTVSGWGTTKESGSLSDDLLYTEVPVITDNECRSKYGNIEIAESMLCAGLLEKGGKDSCQGDSGGPMASGSGSDRILIGIVSWGYGCARPEYPGVYTEVSYFLDFLEKEGCIYSGS